MAETILRSAYLCIVLSICSALPRAKPPHVIFVVVDDVGWADFGYSADRDAALLPEAKVFSPV